MAPRAALATTWLERGVAAPHVSVDQEAENWKQLSPSKLPEPASVNKATAQRFSNLPKQDYQLGTKCSDTGL